MKQILVILCFTVSLAGLAQSGIEVRVHNRVDTTNTEVREILALWINYLNSKPDSIYDNPYWNSREKEELVNFDLSIRFMYPFSSGEVLNYFTPNVLTILPVQDDTFQIRTLFYREGLEKPYSGSNPWTILKVLAVKEQDRWVLANNINYLCRNWKRKTTGKIEYIFPPEHRFNQNLATKAVRFCDSVASLFHVSYEPLKFYITGSGDQMGTLLAFDFYFAGYTTGTVRYEDRLLFSGLGSEYYPHELVHLILDTLPKNDFVNEGIATYLGGSMNESFRENVQRLADAVKHNDTIDLWDIYDRKWGHQYNAFYAAGAIVCDLVYKEKGISGLRDYIRVPVDKAEYLAHLFRILGRDPEEIDVLWKEYLTALEE